MTRKTMIAMSAWVLLLPAGLLWNSPDILAQASGVGRGAGGSATAARASGASAAIGQGAASARADREAELRDREEELQDRQRERLDRENELYDDGTEALDESRWEKAIEKFDQVAGLRGSKADAALYWKAYAQNRLGRKADALATLDVLKQSYPKSRWLNDAKALEVEVRQNTGQAVSPEAESDCELKLLAINGLQTSDPSRAVPLLEKFLTGGRCPKLKSKALFVLAQSGTPEARGVIVRIAKGESHPELQRKAVQYLGLFGGKEGVQALSEIYSSSNDMDVKRQILRSFMISGQRELLLAAAKGEKSPELRGEAVRQLGLMGAQDQLWQIYQQDNSAEVKGQIIQAMFIGGAADKLAELARTEKNEELRLKAIRNLGLMGADRTGAALSEIYKSDKDPAARREVLRAFFLQGNVKALIGVARTETDPELKKAAVQNLSLMHSKEATDFLLEILNK